MSLKDAVRVKMLQVEEAAANLDKTADYDETKVVGFYFRALCQGGKVYELQVNSGDPAFAGLLTAFGKLVTKLRTASQAVLSAVGIQ